MSDSGGTRDGPLWTEGGSPARARAWQVVFWVFGVVGFVFVASVPEDGHGDVWPLFVGAVLMAVAFVALVRWRKQARVPRVVAPMLLQVSSRRGLPGGA